MDDDLERLAGNTGWRGIYDLSGSVRPPRINRSCGGFFPGFILPSRIAVARRAPHCAIAAPAKALRAETTTTMKERKCQTPKRLLIGSK